MSPRSLAFIAIRLGALYFGLQAALSLSILLPGLLTASGTSRQLFIGQVAIPVALVAVGVWAWVFGGWLAGQVSRGCQNPAPPDPFTPAKILLLIISAMGIWLLVSEVPIFVTELYEYWAISHVNAVAPLQGVIRSGLAILFGFVLVLGSSGVAQLVAKFRELGLPK